MPAKLVLFLPVVFIGVALDQITKLLVVRALPLGAQIPVIAGFFNLVHVHNRGAAFGLLASLSASFAWMFFICTTSLVIAVVGYLWWRLPDREKLAGLGYSLILTGAVGNLIDRIRLRVVIDFLDFHLGRHHWPAFNVADSLICLGAGLLVIWIFTEEKQRDASHPV